MRLLVTTWGQGAEEPFAASSCSNVSFTQQTWQQKHLTAGFFYLNTDVNHDHHARS